jgi:hypothetical protein
MPGEYLDMLENVLAVRGLALGGFLVRRGHPLRRVRATGRESVFVFEDSPGLHRDMRAFYVGRALRAIGREAPQ